VGKPVILYKPRFAEISPLFNFIVAEFVIAGIAAASYLIARFVAVGESEVLYSITGYSLAALLAFFIPYTIWLRIDAHQSTIQISEEGIFIKTPTLQQRYTWKQITFLYMTLIVYPRGNDIHEGFLYLFFKLHYGELPQTLLDQRKGRPYHFLGTSTDFSGFLGKSESFDFAICLGNISESESKRLITLLPRGDEIIRKNVRPLIKVQTEDEYNNIVRKTYLPETAEAYLFPKTNLES